MRSSYGRFLAAAWCACGAAAVASCGGPELATSGVSASDAAPSDVVQTLERRARKARAQAEQAGRDASRDRETEARLLEQAAEEAQQEDILVRQSQVLSGEVSTLEREVAQLQRRMDAHHRKGVRAEAAALAMRQSQRAFEQVWERRMPARERSRLQQEAAGVLRRRAGILLAAAESLGASEEDRARAENSVRQSKTASDPAQEITLAERALQEAYRSLSVSRLDDAPPSAVRHALRDAFEAANLAVEQRDEGMFVVLDDVFDRSRRGAARAQATLSRVGAVLVGLERGPVHVLIGAQGNLSSQQVQQRKVRLERAFRDAGLPGERLEFVEAPDVPDDAVVFLPALAPPTLAPPTLAPPTLAPPTVEPSP